MSFFVFRHDDYENVGGIGLDKFDTKEEACLYIESRIAEAPKHRDIDYYVLIEGIELSFTETPKNL